PLDGVFRQLYSRAAGDRLWSAGYALITAKGGRVRTVNGIGVDRGVVVGAVKQMAEPLAEPSGEPRTSDADTEKAAASEALEAAAAELSARGDAAGGTAKEVLAAQALMAA